MFDLHKHVREVENLIVNTFAATDNVVLDSIQPNGGVAQLASTSTVSRKYPDSFPSPAPLRPVRFRLAGIS